MVVPHFGDHVVPFHTHVSPNAAPFPNTSPPPYSTARVPSGVAANPDPIRLVGPDTPGGGCGAPSAGATAIGGNDNAAAFTLAFTFTDREVDGTGAAGVPVDAAR
jgi:hypothetical protein